MIIDAMKYKRPQMKKKLKKLSQTYRESEKISIWGFQKYDEWLIQDDCFLSVEVLYYAVPLGVCILVFSLC